MSHIKYSLSLCLVLSSISYFSLKNAVLIFLNMASFISCFLLNALRVLKSLCNRILDTLQNASILLPSWILRKFNVSSALLFRVGNKIKGWLWFHRDAAIRPRWIPTGGWLTPQVWNPYSTSTVFCITLSSNFKKMILLLITVRARELGVPRPTFLAVYLWHINHKNWPPTI